MPFAYCKIDKVSIKKYKTRQIGDGMTQTHSNLEIQALPKENLDDSSSLWMSCEKQTGCWVYDRNIA